MRKFLFTLLLILAAIVGYYYFFGKGSEKATAQTVVQETGDLVKAVGNFLGKQKEKSDKGEFDNLLEKIRSALNKFKSNPSADTNEVKDSLRDLEDQLKQIDTTQLNEEDRKELRLLIKELENDRG